jgi:actin-related protein
VTDWELYERLLDHGFQKALGVDPKHHPVLLAEPTYNTRQLRERATELLFEKYQVPALFTAKNPVLSTYARRHLHAYFFLVSRLARCAHTNRYAPIVSDSRRAEAQRSSWTRAAL